MWARTWDELCARQDQGGSPFSDLSSDRALSCPGPTSKFSHDCTLRTGWHTRYRARSHAAPDDLGAAARGRTGYGNPEGCAGPSVGDAFAWRVEATRG